MHKNKEKEKKFHKQHGGVRTELLQWTMTGVKRCKRISYIFS